LKETINEGESMAHAKAPVRRPRAARPVASNTTPLNVRLSGVTLDDATRDWVARRTERQLGKFSQHIERVTVRLKDVNGPRGGTDQLCRVKVVLPGLPSTLVEERAATPRDAFNLAASSATRAVRKSIERAGSRLPRGPGRAAAPGTSTKKKSPPAPRNPEGSLIGRRVGRAKENLMAAADRPEKRRRDASVDTAMPGVSASDRKVGASATATRNTKLRRKGMTATLEDSATGKPSRKSTRRSANRAKSGSKLERQAKRSVTSPKARAARGRAGGGL
jgi:hypothetical protein